MPTRNLAFNTEKVFDNADKIVSFASKELIKSYKSALDDIRLKIVKLYEAYGISGELTSAQATQFMRLSGMESEIVKIMTPYLEANKELLQDMSVISFDSGYFTGGWAIDQATGVSLDWAMIDDTAVRAAAGIGGEVKVLEGLMTNKEILKHQKVLDKAFTNYGKDSRKWISREIKQGLIQGESIPKVTKRIKGALGKSYNSSMLIARTEVLRSSGLGSQISYAEARDQGVEMLETWDATLDDRTRPSHVAADGLQMNNETGLFDLPWGQYAGPHRSGIAAEDIQCRCRTVPEIEGYSPSMRNVRGEGLQPYQTADAWRRKKGLTKNRYGQKYNL